MGCVKFKALVSSKTIVYSPTGEKLIKIEFFEEREVPGPIIVQKGSQDSLAREIAPIITQVMRSLPFMPGGKVSVPRVTVFLTEDEWDRIVEKPEIGEEVVVEFCKGRITASSQ